MDDEILQSLQGQIEYFANQEASGKESNAKKNKDLLQTELDRLLQKNGITSQDKLQASLLLQKTKEDSLKGMFLKDRTRFLGYLGLFAFIAAGVYYYIKHPKIFTK